MWLVCCTCLFFYPQLPHARPFCVWFERVVCVCSIAFVFFCFAILEEIKEDDITLAVLIGLWYNTDETDRHARAPSWLNVHISCGSTVARPLGVWVANHTMRSWRRWLPAICEAKLTP